MVYDTVVISDRKGEKRTSPGTYATTIATYRGQLGILTVSLWYLILSVRILGKRDRRTMGETCQVGHKAAGEMIANCL